MAAAAAELVEPEVRTSRDGLLDTTLTCRVEPVPVAGRTATVSVYEGSFPWPTLRVRPGDTLRVNLLNQLDDLPTGLPQSSPFLCHVVTGPGHSASDHVSSCDTNLHVHGLHVSPSDNSDNIFLTVRAGESFQYEYRIPAAHPAGLYWYHPHQHGTVTNQVFGGMAGPIIIEGDIDNLPGVAGVPERLLVLQATQLSPDGNVIDITTDARSQQKSYLRLVNGQLNPTMTIRPGETQRWRILNATANVTYLLHLDGHQLHQIAKDGNTLNETWTRDAINLAPGERVEVLVQAGSAGTYTFRTLPIATGFTTQADATLASLVVDGDAMTPQPLPTALLPVEDLSTAVIDEHRRFTFQFGTPINPPETRFWINSKQFDGERDDAVVRLNTTEEWVIRNASSSWHPFHIHINDYQVVAVNGQPVPVRYHEDTTGLPPFGEITMRTRFRDFPGRWVFHCHILLHEDHGMMGTVRALA
ncbi:MAG: multicopper oxidase family protein [Chloroflexia bacterium]|nr:multicopper oxidase family protein [Chloroflexia bacterium]